MAGLCIVAVLAPGGAFWRRRRVTGRGGIAWAGAVTCAVLWATGAASGFDGADLPRSLVNFLGPWPWAVAAGALGVGAVNTTEDLDPPTPLL